MKKKYLYISLALVLSAGLYSCDDDDAPLYPEENDELVEVSDDKSGITGSSEKINIIKGPGRAMTGSQFLTRLWLRPLLKEI